MLVHLLLLTGLSWIYWFCTIYVALFPGSPPLYFIHVILFTRNYYAERGEGESLGGFDHVQTLMTCSVSIVSTYESPKEQEARISVLVGFLECSTDGSFDGQDFHSQHFDASRSWISDSASELAAIIQWWLFSEIQEHEASNRWTCKKSR